jgi:hypothetical protein
MEGKDEMELPHAEIKLADYCRSETETDADDGGSTKGDLGPAPDQTSPPVQSDIIRTCGVHVSDVAVYKSKEDEQIAAELEECVKSSSKGDKMPRLSWPAVGQDMVDEYDKAGKLFCKAFPWLFPGGIGDICDYHKNDMKVSEWVAALLYYFDGRFARDKMWCFFALNFMTRRRNQGQGRFFVDNFYKDCPESLEDLKNHIRQGDWTYIDRISYFSDKVRGSSSFWRAKRAQLYSWINYHVGEGDGAPNYFMTFSCAEYHWPDIRRLLKERQELYPAMPDGDEANNKQQNIVRLADDLSIVIQEYFQIRVKEFLETVGRELLGITHYWLRYEFAPSRGQVHAHMLAIANEDVRHFFRELHQHNGNDKKQAAMLEQWSSQLMRYTANVDSTVVDDQNISKTNNPCQRRFADVEDVEIDANELLMFTQHHVCSDYCMRSKKKG